MKLHHKNPFIKQALDVLAPLGLDNNVHPEKIRLNDAANYLAKILHEERKDDPTVEVLAHLGVAKGANASFEKNLAEAIKNPVVDKEMSERLKIEAACKADGRLVAKHKEQLKKWAIDDIEEQAKLT